MDRNELTAEQRAEIERIEDVGVATARAEIGRMAEVMAARGNGELFGETEFELRDAMHRVGAAMVEAALEERKKGATADR